MINDPEITIIMPVFNTEAYVDSAVESVLDQTFKSFELLLINDGSTDGSLSRLANWAEKDARVRVFSQANQGLSGARNTGIEHAKGNFIYFMDSDDLIKRDTLHTCYKYCKENHLDFVFFDAETFADEIQDTALSTRFNYSRIYFEPKVIVSGIEAFEKLLKYDEFFSSVCLLFINRTFLTRIGLRFEKYIVHEDELFTTILFMEAHKTYYIPATFFMRRLRTGSIMMVDYSMKNINSYFIVGIRLLDYSKNNAKIRDIVVLYLRGMIDAAVWKAYKMQLKNRVTVFVVCLRRWRKYVKIKTLCVLLFKKYTRS
ncbi:MULTISPECIES: glycosyltransferase family 2 protein [unclassified Sphingobacterium]|uniref:glycosyltransferase family 2 protein n=1 Tax=unclassified Sphingobacterium TaxID=2609468 RepID=UPI0025D3212E|nr:MULTISPECIES: glycosyltransferase [unclassified Sphingobacterium]